MIQLDMGMAGGAVYYLFNHLNTDARAKALLAQMSAKSEAVRMMIQNLHDIDTVIDVSVVDEGRSKTTLIGPKHFKVELSIDEAKNWQFRTTTGSLANFSLERIAIHELFGHVPLFITHGVDALPYRDIRSGGLFSVWPVRIENWWMRHGAWGQVLHNSIPQADFRRGRLR